VGERGATHRRTGRRLTTAHQADNLTAVTGVATGTFTQPMPDGNGGFFQPTGKKYAINMVTVGIWNKQGVMDEEFIIYDQLTFMRQLGLA
jgi:hypothetical protein